MHLQLAGHVEVVNLLIAAPGNGPAKALLLSCRGVVLQEDLHLERQYIVDDDGREEGQAVLWMGCKGVIGAHLCLHLDTW